MCKKTSLSLSNLRDIASTTENSLQVKILDSFAEDFLLTFLNEPEAEPQEYDGNLLDVCQETADGTLVSFSGEDQINLLENKDLYLNYEFVIEGTVVSGFFYDLTIKFTKIEFNFLNNTWDFSSNSIVKDRLVAKMNEYESDKMTLVE